MNVRVPTRTQKRPLPAVPIRKRKHQALKVIDSSQAANRSILELNVHGTVFVIGDGPPISYDCGNCGSPLLVDVKAEQVENVVWVCANCGSLNESPE